MSGMINPTKQDMTMFAPVPQNPDPNKAPIPTGFPTSKPANKKDVLMNELLKTGLSNEQGNELLRLIQGINATKK